MPHHKPSKKAKAKRQHSHHTSVQTKVSTQATKAFTQRPAFSPPSHTPRSKSPSRLLPFIAALLVAASARAVGQQPETIPSLNYLTGLEPGGLSLYYTQYATSRITTDLLSELPQRTGTQLFPNYRATALVEPPLCLNVQGEPRAFLYTEFVGYNITLAELIQNATNAICAESDAAYNEHSAWEARTIIAAIFGTFGIIAAISCLTYWLITLCNKRNSPETKNLHTSSNGAVGNYGSIAIAVTAQNQTPAPSKSILNQHSHPLFSLLASRRKEIHAGLLTNSGITDPEEGINAAAPTLSGL